MSASFRRHCGAHSSSRCGQRGVLQIRWCLVSESAPTQHVYLLRRSATRVEASLGAYVGVKSAGEGPAVGLGACSADRRLQVHPWRLPYAGEVQRLCRQKSSGFWQAADKQINVRRCAGARGRYRARVCRLPRWSCPVCGLGRVTLPPIL